MAKVLRVVDTEKWVQYQKAKWVASEFKIHYQTLTEKLSGSRKNDTQFRYGTLQKFEDYIKYTNNNGQTFFFKFIFYDKNLMQTFYIVDLENIGLVKVNEKRAFEYLNKNNVEF